MDVDVTAADFISSVASVFFFRFRGVAGTAEKLIERTHGVISISRMGHGKLPTVLT